MQGNATSDRVCSASCDGQYSFTVWLSNDTSTVDDDGGAGGGSASSTAAIAGIVVAVLIAAATSVAACLAVVRRRQSPADPHGAKGVRAKDGRVAERPTVVHNLIFDGGPSGGGEGGGVAIHIDVGGSGADNAGAASRSGGGRSSPAYDSVPADAASPPCVDRRLQPVALEAGYGGLDSVQAAPEPAGPPIVNQTARNGEVIFFGWAFLFDFVRRSRHHTYAPFGHTCGDSRNIESTAAHASFYRFF